MASSVGGDAGEGEWLKVTELRAMAEAQDPHVKVRSFVRSFVLVAVVVFLLWDGGLSMHLYARRISAISVTR